MPVIDARTWIEHLSQERCWELLGATRVGRLAVLVDSLPEVYPVNFVTDGHSVVFRTDEGNKLHGLGRSPSVCFEADALDPEEEGGWSVLLKGAAEEITDPDERRAVEQLPLRLWALGPKSHWIRIRPWEVTGRWIHPPDAPLAHDHRVALVTSGGDAFAEARLEARARRGGWQGELTEIMWRTQMVPVPLRPEERLQLLDVDGRPVTTVTVVDDRGRTATVRGTGNPFG